MTAARKPRQAKMPPVVLDGRGLQHYTCGQCLYAHKPPAEYEAPKEVRLCHALPPTPVVLSEDAIESHRPDIEVGDHACGLFQARVTH